MFLALEKPPLGGGGPQPVSCDDPLGVVYQISYISVI